jgi:hypothetical protein
MVDVLTRGEARGLALVYEHITRRIDMAQELVLAHLGKMSEKSQEVSDSARLMAEYVSLAKEAQPRCDLCASNWMEKAMEEYGRLQELIHDYNNLGDEFPAEGF